RAPPPMLYTLSLHAALPISEPELVLVIGADGGIVGYTTGNDVSSRSIEGENPLYLPQAKVYDGSCAIGPGIRVCDAARMRDLAVDRKSTRLNSSHVQISYAV